MELGRCCTDIVNWSLGGVTVAAVKMEDGLVDEEVHGKRRRNETEWGRNKRTKLRAEGKEYVTTRNNVMPTRTTGEICRLVRHQSVTQSQSQ